MLFRLFAFLCLPLLSHAGALSDDAEGKFSTGAPAGWVKPCNFSYKPIPTKTSQKNTQYLLVDTQRNWQEKATYRHYAVKALTQSGVDAISQVTIDFEPSFRKLVVHDIRIIRDGIASDRLESSEHHLIQQEMALGFGIYTGDLTAVYLLDDVRIGDIVEYSYSVIGENPLFTSHYTDLLHIERGATVEKLSYRLLSTPDHLFTIHPVNTTLEPTITDLSPSMREWWWQMTETPVSEREWDDPMRASSYARIELSEYKSWQEVGEKVSKLFALPENFATSCPQEMTDLVREWENSANTLFERALLAVRFVQDEIRYMGIEEGIAGFQPTDPRLVFERRYGDCKDKTRLLQTFLYMMHIRSTPLLVHSYRGELISDMIPTPYAFNHAVLQIEIGGKEFYVDPTIQMQGGTLATLYFPAYDTALLLSKEAPKLISLPADSMERPIEIETEFRVITKDSAELTTTFSCHGSNADYMRKFVDSYGKKNLSEDDLNDLREIYGSAKTLNPLTILDDRTENIFQISKSYVIPTRGKAKGKTLKFFSSVIEDFLDSAMHPERESAYALIYPLWVKEHVHVENPFGTWDASSDTKTYEHPSLFFSRSEEIRKTSADFCFELKHLQDHVPQDALLDYWNICQEIEEGISHELTISTLRRYFSKRR